MQKTETKDFFYRRLWTPIRAQLRQGTTPEKLAWSVAAGLSVSLFPIFGATTPLGVLAGAVFRLNHVVLQAVNYLATPLQIAALPILVRLGETLFGIPHVTFNPIRLGGEFTAAPHLFLRTYGASALAGVVVWAILTPFVLIAVRMLFLPFMKRKLASPPPADAPLP